jgi:opacity protein-like surface antigen
MRWSLDVMHVFRSFAFVVVVLGLAASPSAAQQRTAAPPQPLRGYLIGGGGTSIGVSDPAMTLSAEIAENVQPDVQVYMSAGYYDNVMSQAARDQLTAVASFLTTTTGTPWQFEGRDRGRSFTVGGKFLVPTGTAVRPYLGGGVGVLNLRRSIREVSRGNITRAYLAQFGSGDGVVDITQSNTNKPMAEVAAGIGAVIGHGYVDVGYRYRKAFHASQSFDISQVGVAVGVKF